MKSPRILLAMLATFPLALSLGGCAAALGGAEDGSDESDPAAEADGRATESLSVGVDCSHPRDAVGYSHGSSFTIRVVDADSHPIEEKTAGAYAEMQRAAENDGVALRIVSGFRTNAQQQALYDSYLAGTGNLAARPGYSNHQSGHALDLNTSASGVYTWLQNHAASFGFKRTVPSEIWHWEYWGPGVSGGCTHTAPPPAPPSTGGCFSHTLGRQMPLNACVQSSSDRNWYQCLASGSWDIRWSVAAKCSSEHPL